MYSKIGDTSDVWHHHDGREIHERKTIVARMCSLIWSLTSRFFRRTAIPSPFSGRVRSFQRIFPPVHAWYLGIADGIMTALPHSVDFQKAVFAAKALMLPTTKRNAPELQVLQSFADLYLLGNRIPDSAFTGCNVYSTHASNNRKLLLRSKYSVLSRIVPSSG